jgi:adenylate cyclase
VPLREAPSNRTTDERFPKRCEATPRKKMTSHSQSIQAPAVLFSVMGGGGNRNTSPSSAPVFVDVQALIGRLAILEQSLTEARYWAGRLTGLRSFLLPEVFGTLAGEEMETLWRREDRNIVVAFADLRGFTTFAEQHSLDEVTATLDEFFAEMGEPIRSSGGTLERFTGDGLMVFFNDSTETSGAADRAVAMAFEMQSAASRLKSKWRARAIELGLGIGIARGRARVGPIGCRWRMDYGAIGSVVNLAQRLCARATAGEILIERVVLTALQRPIAPQQAEQLTLPGLSKPLAAVRVAPESRATARRHCPLAAEA